MVAFGETPGWRPEAPPLRIGRVLLLWIVGAISVAVAAWLLPGVDLEATGAAFFIALAIAVFNAIVPPVLAALRVPGTIAVGFLLVLLADAAMLKLASDAFPDHIHVESFTDSLLAALTISAVGTTLHVVLGINDDDRYSLRVTQRIARRQGVPERTDVPGIIFLEIDGLAFPVLRDAMRDGSAPELASWIADDGYQLHEWETDLSSQTGASQAGILLGSNDDFPAYRWVEKETGRMISCSSIADCTELERRLASGRGLLMNGGASRGNLLSGEADEMILTISRIEAEKRANPGYRAFLANGFNVTRVLVLFGWEVILEVVAAARARRRNVRPRGHRGGTYPLLRAAMCVIIRDLIVNAVVTDMMRGRPAVYATFSSYDEVAHHSGLERADTFEALRKLDQQLGNIARARKYAPRPYEIVVLSDHGQTQGATFKQRNGYGLDELVERSLDRKVTGVAGGDEQHAMIAHAVNEARARVPAERSESDVSDRDVIVLGSGNLGLVYLMELDRRLTLEEIDERHPNLLPALRSHPHIGWLLVRSGEHGAMALGANGTNFLDEGRVEGEDPLAHFPATAAQHLRRTDGFAHVADIMVGSFYDPTLDDACAFEELISFHGGLGGAQTRAFILAPEHLRVPEEPIVGAAAVHAVLSGWRARLQEPAALEAA